VVNERSVLAKEKKQHQPAALQEQVYPKVILPLWSGQVKEKVGAVASFLRIWNQDLQLATT
jgi:hypothetical protein